MKRVTSVVLAVMVCVFAMVATEKRAHAYVNPGDGLLVIQSVASAAAAVGYFFRRKIAEMFSNSSAKVKTVKALTPSASKRETRRPA